MTAASKNKFTIYLPNGSMIGMKDAPSRCGRDRCRAASHVWWRGTLLNITTSACDEKYVVSALGGKIKRTFDFIGALFFLVMSVPMFYLL